MSAVPGIVAASRAGSDDTAALYALLVLAVAAASLYLLGKRKG